MRKTAAHKEQPSTITTVENYINGKFSVSASGEYLPVTNPSIGLQIAKVPLSPPQEIDDAVKSARAAYPAWSMTPIRERARSSTVTGR